MSYFLKETQSLAVERCARGVTPNVQKLFAESYSDLFKICTVFGLHSNICYSFPKGTFIITFSLYCHENQ